MHSRRHPKYQRSNFPSEVYDDDNGKSSSYSKVIAFIMGVLLCLSLVSQLYSSEAGPKTSAALPTFRTAPLPSLVQYEDFPDINVQDVKEKALALLKGGENEEEAKLEEKEREEQQREEEEEEEKFLREQAIMDAEQALEKRQKDQQPPLQLSHAALVEESLTVAKEQLRELHMMKYESHIVMETDHLAQERIQAVQSSIRKFLILKYGAGPYYVKMVLQFPNSMLHEASTGGLKGSAAAATPREEEIIIELAPIDYVPYSVYMFLENMVTGYKSGRSSQVKLSMWEYAICYMKMR